MVAAAAAAVSTAAAAAVKSSSSLGLCIGGICSLIFTFQLHPGGAANDWIQTAGCDVG